MDDTSEGFFLVFILLLFIAVGFPFILDLYIRSKIQKHRQLIAKESWLAWNGPLYYTIWQRKMNNARKRLLINITEYNMRRAKQVINNQRWW